MRTRMLGKTGWMVSEVGYGAWGIGGQQWRGATDDESVQALRRALEVGLNFIDTALAYGEGHSERLVGQVLRETSTQAWVATKIPPKNRRWPALPGVGIDSVFPFRYAVESTETSLKNLGVDTIDLQQFHVWNPEWAGSDEWRRTVDYLKRSGKIRHFGVSLGEHDPDSGLELVRSGLVDTIQVIYNIFDQSPESTLFPLTSATNIGILARVPLDEGALTGAITPETQFDPHDFRAFYFRGDRKQQVSERVAALSADLKKEGLDAPLAETAIRFCLAHPAVSTVIPGMRKVRNVEANCAASDKGPLSAGALEVLRRHQWDRNFYN
jgi:aryl-alcohol dehydrogenase-like predicted oxidoreductase